MISTFPKLIECYQPLFYNIQSQLLTISASTSMAIKPATYFELMEIVGTKGPYQTRLFMIMSLLWLVTSLLVMGTSFLFLNPKFNCDALDLDTQQCENYVCSLPESERHSFLEQQNVISLATQFGPFHCDKVFLLSALRMTLYIGILFGYIVVFYITDNYGRKFSMVVSWGVTVFGILILSFAFNIWMSVVGLFFAGLGCESCIRITMTMIGETVQNSLRQKYSIFLQISFGIGSIIIGLGYMWIQNWRTITIAFCLIPSIILQILLIFSIEQTPKFLLQKSIQKTLNSMNRIARINQKQIKLIEQDIVLLTENEHSGTIKRTPLDLLRYKSIRWSFIFACLFMFCINFLYMGPAVIISQLNISIFASQIILGATQAISYPFCSLFIEQLPRKKSGYFLVGIPLLIFCVLSFFDVQIDCENCIEGLIKTILVFSARFCICAYFSVFFLFLTEIYPLPVRGIGFGMTSVFGALASTTSQFVLSSISKTKINPMIIFSFISVIGILALLQLPQTLHKNLEQEIEEEKIDYICEE